MKFHFSIHHCYGRNSNVPVLGKAILDISISRYVIFCRFERSGVCALSSNNTIAESYLILYMGMHTYQNTKHAFIITGLKINFFLLYTCRWLGYGTGTSQEETTASPETTTTNAESYASSGGGKSLMLQFSAFFSKSLTSALDLLSI